MNSNQRLDDVHVEARNCTVEVGTNHLLTVASHDTLTWGEVLRCEDRRRYDERHVRSVDVAGLEVAATLVADEDLVPWEVRILVDSEAVAESTNLVGTDDHAADLSLAVQRERRLEVNRSLEDGCDVRTNNNEVC